MIDCEYMKHLINYLVSRNSFSGNFYSFVILNFRSFCGLMMLPYGYGKIVNYDRYAADFFGNPICIGNIPSLWLTIFAQTICPIMLIVGFQTRLAASILAFNMLIKLSILHQSYKYGMRRSLSVLRAKKVCTFPFMSLPMSVLLITQHQQS